MRHPSERARSEVEMGAAIGPDPWDAADEAGAGHRLGPMVSIVAVGHPVFGRLYAAGVAAGAGALLLTAAWLTPSRAQMGTHRQLGLPPCGFVITTGFPCPTCGMTTAFAHTVRGEFPAAMRAQVGGFVLAAGTIVAFVLSLMTTVTGRRPSMNWYRLPPLWLVWGLLVLLMGSWAFKVFLGLVAGMDRRNG